MTVVVGYKTDTNYYLAADDEVSDRYTKDAICDSKIFNFGEFFLGVAGRIKVINAFEYWECPKRKKEETFDKYVKTTLIKALCKQLEEHEVIGRDKGIPEGNDSYILISSFEGLYVIQMDLSVYKIKDSSYAIGSGCEVARGALDMMKYLKKFNEELPSDEDLLKRIISICSKHCVGVGKNSALLKGDIK